MGNKASTSSYKEHKCNKSCFGNLKANHLKCKWYPFKPSGWIFENEHKLALQDALNNDYELKHIGEDVMNIIISYIEVMLIENNDRNNKNEIYYKHIRSNIYDENKINQSYIKICNKYFFSFLKLNENYHYQLQIVVFGTSKVGKTSLVHRAITDTIYTYIPTLNPQQNNEEIMRSKMVQINDEQTFIVQLMDVEVEHLFDFAEQCVVLEDQYIAKWNIFWLCFDVMNEDTFDYIIEILQRILKIKCQEKKCVIFVGCKNDLKFTKNVNKDKQIDSFHVKKRIEAIGDFPYIETSAISNNHNIEYLLEVSIYEAWMQMESHVIDWDSITIH